MLHGKRTDKVALEIKRVVAEVLLYKAKDPRIGFVTVTDVKISPDLKHAIIYISVLGTQKNKKSSMIALNYAKGFFQQEIGQKLKLKYTPKVEFRLDDAGDKTAEIDAILKKIRDEEPGTEEPSSEE